MMTVGELVHARLPDLFGMKPPDAVRGAGHNPAVDRPRSPSHRHGNGTLSLPAGSSRSGTELREQQTEELRRERDRLVLDLSRSLGTEGLASCLDTSAATTEALVQRARGRLGGAGEEVVARRLTSGQDRWAEADRHYEALGRIRLPFES